MMSAGKVLSTRNIYGFILIFCFLWAGNIIVSVRTARYALPVSVEFVCPGNVYDQIEVFRISPSGIREELLKEPYPGSTCFLGNRNYQKIEVSIPERSTGEISRIVLSIGEHKEEFGQNEIPSLRQKSGGDENSIILPPESVATNRSSFPVLNRIFNWPGDRYFFTNTFFPPFIFTGFILLAAFFCSFHVKRRLIQHGGRSAPLTSFTDNINEWLKSDPGAGGEYKLFYGAAIFLIFSTALLQRIVMNQLPYCSGDVWGFIGSAINWLETGSYVRVCHRSFPYPSFILGVLNVFDDFAYISIVQHIIGLATGAVLLVIWRNLFYLFELRSSSKVGHDLSGLVLTALFLLSEIPVVYENYILRESIYPFFLIVQIFLLVKFLNGIRRADGSPLLWGPLFFIHNYFLFMYQPRWVLAAIFNLIFYTVCVILIKKRLWQKVVLLFMAPAVFSFIFIYVPENLLIERDTASEAFLPPFLFMTHAGIINKEIENDIKDISFDRYERELLKTVKNSFEKEFAREDKIPRHKFLGFDFLRLFYESGMSEYLSERMSGEEKTNFYLYYFTKSVFRHPLQYARKVFLEMSQFYNFRGEMYADRKYFTDREIYFWSYELLTRRYDYEQLTIRDGIQYKPYIDYENALYQAGNSSSDVREIRCRWVPVFYLYLSKTYLVCFMLFFLLFISEIYMLLTKRSHRNLFLPGITVFILFMYNFCINLSNAMIYCLDMSRYIDDQLILVVFSQILVIQYIYMFFTTRAGGKQT